MRAHLLALGTGLFISFVGCECGDDPPSGLEDASKPGDGGEALDGAVNPPICVSDFEPCNRAVDLCCSGICGQDGLCAAPIFCLASDSNCTSSSQCCNLSCVSGRCDSSLSVCGPALSACTSNAACCSGICGPSGQCDLLPPGPGGDDCTTLGEVCTSSTACCSTNCQGGHCVRAYSCQANGDICRSDAECCGNVCSATSTTAGRCQFITGGGGGGCVQGGNPCPSGGNCCSRLCVDPGTGADVCQVAGGCVLTGEFCESDQECCGGGTNPNGSVMCREAPRGRCDNGNACNPSGNICGAPVLPGGGSINASQNCCDGKKDVCKLDLSGIPRCFGGCPNDVCPAGCPTGFDGTDPNCCIAEGDGCQLRDQCCNFLPCLPGASGALVCTTPPPPPDAGPAPDLGSPGDGGPGPDLGAFDGGDAGIRDGGPIPDSGLICNPVTAGCGTGAQCCSQICSGATCAPPLPCQGSGAVCTASGDCCSGFLCRVTAGATTGTCQAGALCNANGQACGPTAGCCPSLTCVARGTFSACDGTTACSCRAQL